MQRQIERLKLDPWQNTKQVASSDPVQFQLKWQTSTICRFYYTFHPATVLWNSNSESSSTFFSQKDQISHQSSNKKANKNMRLTQIFEPHFHHHLAIEIPIADCLLSSYFCRPRGRPSPDTGPRGALGVRARPRFGWLELGILGSWVDEAWKMMEPPKGLLEVSLFVVSQVSLTWICPPSFKQSWSWTLIWRKMFFTPQWQDARCTRCLVFFQTSWQPMVIWLDCILSTSWNHKTIRIIKYRVVARNNLGMVKNEVSVPQLMSISCDLKWEGPINRCFPTCLSRVWFEGLGYFWVL